MKILIVLQSLANGGAERSGGLLSVLLSNLGFDVHIVTVLDGVEFEYKGELLNLGILKKKNDTLFGRLQRLLVLRSYLKENNFDWIIDNRPRNSSFTEFIISRYIYNPKKVIYVVRSFNISNYFPQISFIAKIIYREAPSIIGVSNEIKEAIIEKYGYQNVRSIYNPFDKELILSHSNEYKVKGNFILAYGRIDDEVKNYSLLIDAYSKSILSSYKIDLLILGDGKDLEKLIQKVKTLNLSDRIKFVNKLSNPFPYVKKAIFTVLTSKYEGFPRVIVESLAIGTPVISVDCKSGPKEIISNKINGLLVENNSEDELAKAMNLFIEDKDLYQKCKKNASLSVNHLTLESITEKWKEILK
ncbi:glycosyltransferase [Flavobacterium sp. UMI-01]|uniref:glycosyltransferase n=1 Tax=Flavobacterium sp. UMI-01 TaxID=1441053 RepID=UPI001C7D5DB2|nr:glycosyltransferase [Flavobacterium sp. UMI-01]GIZ10485.1 glycosyl transferase [Flavobacterium sp. UMI-01]